MNLSLNCSTCEYIGYSLSYHSRLWENKFLRYISHMNVTANENKVEESAGGFMESLTETVHRKTHFDIRYQLMIKEKI
eukprot:snap_masked-scaffold_81-processed-gene-0.1-mRNA-1 protein AED:1.00 eAED:1.00 QI:0/0/0/0/1/1/2/0/77